MDSSPSKTLTKLLEEIISRCESFDVRFFFDVRITPGVASHLQTVLSYVSTLSVDPDFSLRMDAKLCDSEVWNRRFEPPFSKKFAKIVVSFMQEDLKELFKVPKIQQLPDKNKTLKRNELVAVFISFLLQLLDHSNYVTSMITLRKELRFLITILGDAPFQGTDEVEEVENLLAEFEAVANEAGSLVHSFIFSKKFVRVANEADEFRNLLPKFEVAVDEAENLVYSPIVSPIFVTADEIVGVLLEHTDALKVHIINSLLSLPCTVPKASAVDSLFILDSLLYDLKDLMNLEDYRIVDLKDHIKILHKGLMFSWSLLKDIKVPRYSEVEELKEAVMQIRDVAYEAEYLIKSFSVGDTPCWYLTARLPHLIHKIKLVGTELQEIKKNYDIGALRVAKDFSEQMPLQAKRNSEVDDITVGFEDETICILDQLVGGTEPLQIIAIFGMSGLGKTTLAKKLYNHPSVNYHFDKCSWCVVSQTYQRKNLLIEIVISLGSGLDKVRILNMEEESLAEHIYKSLKGRRYLIVMDDVWNSNVWDHLRRYFPDDGNGSRILFTSRNKDVVPPNSIIYKLPPLSNDECWELLQKKVFHNKPCPPQLLGIGKKIGANCFGLPLAVVVIAGILSTMGKEESTWKNVGESLGQHIFSDQGNSMMQILKLSYKHLPEHLKPCFLYFGAFPADTEIPVKKLKWLWIAEGFIPKEERRSAESVAEEYLMELVDKSPVIVAKRSSDGGAKACVVHDFVRDLCLRIAEEENFLKLTDNNYSIYTKHHRLYVHMNSISGISRHQLWVPFGLHVRSLFGSVGSSLYLFKMKLLRVLDLPNSNLSHGDGSEFLVNLRYLGVSRLPASIKSYVNLEFLVLNVTTGEVVSISSVIHELVNLRYLKVPQAIFDKNSYGRVNNLEFLSCIDIKNEDDERMLKCSPCLRKIKCKCEPFVDKLRAYSYPKCEPFVDELGAYSYPKCEPFVDELGVYHYPDLCFFIHLESLNMTTSRGRPRARINFPSNIKKLSQSGFRLPWEKLSIIGELPKLDVLKLRSNAFVGERWDTKDGQFQQLRFLKLNRLGFAQWNVSSSEHFPRLQRLVLHRCYNLLEIPFELGQCPTLQMIEVELCQKSLAKSAVEIQQEQRDMGNEELRVIFRDIH